MSPSWRTKAAHYGSIINRARIRIPDQRLQDVYNWSRINMEWLVRDVPGIGRGLSGGFMEYPWWFGTETYSVQALMATGDFELAKQTLRLLRNQSDKVNGNGRIVHEITPDAAVSNPRKYPGDRAVRPDGRQGIRMDGRSGFRERDVSRDEERDRLAAGRDGSGPGPVPGRLRDHGGLRLERRADRCRGLHPAGSGGCCAHRREC